jgi:hypothetical protein
MVFLFSMASSAVSGGLSSDTCEQAEIERFAAA